MEKASKTILGILLDKYENSATFKGVNKTNQSFKADLKKIFPKLNDLSDSKTYEEVTKAVRDLEVKGLITVQWQDRQKEYAKQVALNCSQIAEAYKTLSRTPKSETNQQLLSLLNRYKNSCDILNAYCSAQMQNIQNGKSIECFHFGGDFQKAEDILKGVVSALQVEQETFERNFSVRVYGDSKRFEAIKQSVVSILDKYGDFPDKDAILQDLNIIKNPGHVYLKGNAVITVCDQTIDLSAIPSDIALSSELLKDVRNVKLKGRKLITIENLTTFNTFSDSDALIVYLGGYHNHCRRMLLQTIYANNPNAEYYHFGDIDAGGFYILEHLKRKTKIPFKALNMDIASLQNHKLLCKKLTNGDIHRLRCLLGKYPQYTDVIEYMIEHNVKLEQEAICE